MNFIDKDAVVATIKKHVQEERHSYFCKCLLSEIDALEVKEQPSLPDNLKFNMTRTKLELNEIETLTHLVRAKAVEPGNFQGLYKGILSKLNKMFDEEYAGRERKEEKK